MPKTRKIGSIQHLGDGKYRLRVSAGFDDFGKRIQISRVIRAKSDTEAERLLMELYAEKNKLAEERITKPPETLGEIYKEFKENHISKLRPNTQDYYERLWDAYLEKRKRAKLARITPKAIYDILKDCDGKSRTQKALYGMLYTMLKKAVEWGYLDRNPCERVEPPKYKAKEKRPYTETELLEVVKAVEKEPVQFQLIFCFAAMLGMRRSEIVGLKWSDIDFDAGTLSIRRAAARKVGEGTYIDDTKTERSKRTLYLDDVMLDKLRTHRAEQAERRLKLANKWQGEDWIFTQWDGRIMSVETPTRTWLKFLGKYPKLEKTNLHALRHTAATLLIKNNVAISTVSGLLGHAQTSTTLNVYAHAIEDAKKEAANIMSGILSKAKTKM